MIVRFQCLTCVRICCQFFTRESFDTSFSHVLFFNQFFTNVRIWYRFLLFVNIWYRYFSFVNIWYRYFTSGKNRTSSSHIKKYKMWNLRTNFTLQKILKFTNLPKVTYWYQFFTWCDIYEVWILRFHSARNTIHWDPPRGFGEQAKKGIYFRGTGEQGQILRGTGEQRQYWGTGNIRKPIFDFWGTGELANLFQGNKGTGTPLGGPLHWILHPPLYHWNYLLLCFRKGLLNVVITCVLFVKS